MKSAIPLITVLGPTAVGKTSFAAHLASALDAEIISADSRQVFRRMDIGTGKDLADYYVDQKEIRSHLVNIAEPGTEYNVFRYRNDFFAAYDQIVADGKQAIMCGGTGLYLEAILLGYEMDEVPANDELRKKFGKYSDAELIAELSLLRPLHNTTDLLDRDRLIRAIEIEHFKSSGISTSNLPDFSASPVFGIRFDRRIVRDRITARLSQRLNEGMIEEVQQLLNEGIGKARLIMYGLEYKYVTMFLAGELTYDQMFSLLNTAIHQFAKRQMTWFRRMERKGINIFWLAGEDGLETNICKALQVLKLSMYSTD